MVHEQMRGVNNADAPLFEPHLGTPSAPQGQLEHAPSRRTSVTGRKGSLGDLMVNLRSKDQQCEGQNENAGDWSEDLLCGPLPQVQDLVNERNKRFNEAGGVASIVDPNVPCPSLVCFLTESTHSAITLPLSH